MSQMSHLLGAGIMHSRSVGGFLVADRAANRPGLLDNIFHMRALMGDLIPSLVQLLQAKTHAVAGVRISSDLEDHLQMFQQGE
jgi:hypothetical protein